jgi:hypothetical protein
MLQSVERPDNGMTLSEEACYDACTYAHGVEFCNGGILIQVEKFLEVHGILEVGIRFEAFLWARYESPCRLGGSGGIAFVFRLAFF